jgi:nitrite reductase/ring-hydroxylating ferredoxin subunit
LADHKAGPVDYLGPERIVPGNLGNLNPRTAPSLKGNPPCRYKGRTGPAAWRGFVSQERAARRRAEARKRERPMAESVVRVCSQAEIAPETVKAFDVGDLRLAVYSIDGNFYVTDDECTHASASLADGILEGDVIECSLHFGAFDVKTGAVKAPPCSLALRTYKVVLQGDDVFVDLDKNAAGEPA